MNQNLINKLYFFENIKASKILSLIALGILIGVFSIFFHYLWFFIIFVIFFAWLICAFAPKEDKTYVIKIFAISLSIRMILLLVVSFTFFVAGKGGWLFGDEWGISERAWRVVNFLKGYKVMWAEYPPGSWNLAPNIPGVDIKPELLPLGTYGSGGYTSWVSFLYFLFGYATILPKFFNALFGSFAGVLAYFISREIFTEKVAKVSLAIVSFFPTFIFWSILNLKDTFFIFLSLAAMLFFIKFKKKKGLLSLAIFVIILSILTTIRSLLGFMILATFASAYLIMLKRVRIMLKRARKLVIYSILFFLIILFFSNNMFSIKLRKNLIARPLKYHIGHILTGGNYYKILPEKYYLMAIKHAAKAEPLDVALGQISLKELMKVFLLAWIYFLLVPFPWKICNMNEFIIMPLVFIWYILLPFALIGLGLCLRRRLIFSIPLIFYLFLLGSTIVITSGNVGTTFRHRDMLTPFFLIFASFGIVNYFSKTRRDSDR